MKSNNMAAESTDPALKDKTADEDSKIVPRFSSHSLSKIALINQGLVNTDIFSCMFIFVNLT